MENPQEKPRLKVVSGAKPAYQKEPFIDRIAHWFENSSHAKVINGVAVSFGMLGFVVAILAVIFDYQNRELTRESLDLTSESLELTRAALSESREAGIATKRIGAHQILASDADPRSKKDSLEYLHSIGDAISGVVLHKNWKVGDENLYAGPLMLSNSEISASDFSGVNARNSDFSNSTLIQVEFDSVNLFRSSFAGSRISRTNFTNAYLQKVSFQGVRFEMLALIDQPLAGASLFQADFRDVKFWGLMAGDLMGVYLGCSILLESKSLRDTYRDEKYHCGEAILIHHEDQGKPTNCKITEDGDYKICYEEEGKY